MSWAELIKWHHYFNGKSKVKEKERKIRYCVRFHSWPSTAQVAYMYLPLNHSELPLRRILLLFIYLFFFLFPRSDLFITHSALPMSINKFIHSVGKECSPTVAHHNPPQIMDRSKAEKQENPRVKKNRNRWEKTDWLLLQWRRERKYTERSEILRSRRDRQRIGVGIHELKRGIRKLEMTPGRKGSGEGYHKQTAIFYAIAFLIYYIVPQRCWVVIAIIINLLALLIIQ